MENVMKFEDFLNESKSRSFKEKIIELYKKVKHLFGEVKIEITEEKAKEIEKISSIDSLKNIKFDKNIFNRVNKIVKENKKRNRYSL